MRRVRTRDFMVVKNIRKIHEMRLKVYLTTVQASSTVTNGTHAGASLPTAEEGARVCYASAAT